MAFGASLLMLLSAGCVTGSLATDTGPSLTTWSTAKNQSAHVGEEVAFSFILTKDPLKRQPMHPFGSVDYCTANIGSDRIEAHLDEGGHFRFSYTFSGGRPGDVVPVRAVAYREQGNRDSMKIGDEWIQGDDPYDQADRIVAQDTVALTLYRIRIEVLVPRPPEDLDMVGGRLELRKEDGSVTTVYSEERGGSGFRHYGPDQEGVYRVVHEPQAAELSRCGMTQARFVVEDLAGHSHVVEELFETP